MKTLAGILGIMGSLLVVAGAFFKIMHYTGSAMLMMIGFLATAAGFVMMFTANKKSRKRTNVS
jgi:hypothetical protein